MRAFKYLRVSDEEQVKEGFSIAAQDAFLNRKLAEWGYECVGSYTDEGKSAKNMNRPDFQQMLKDIEPKKAQVIVFWRLDRFSRSSKDFHKITEELMKKGCGIKSATENIDTTTAMGRFQLELTVSLGQLERETTAERVKFVMEERHMKGIRQGAVAPYGYVLEEGRLIVLPDEAEVVRRIYKDYVKPMSDTAIAKSLNNDQIPRPSGNHWSGFAVNYILTNPVYCGKLRWNYRKLEGKRTHKEIIVDSTHEAIVTEEEFDNIQKVRNRRSVTREKVSSTYAFTGVLKCGRCGHGMIGVRKKRQQGFTRFYRCLGRSNYGICNMPHIKEDTITEMFLKALEVDSLLFKKLIVVQDIKPIVDDKQDKLVKELEQIQKRRKKWQTAYGADALTLEELKSHMAEEQEKEDLIRNQLEPTVEKEKSQWSKEEIIELLRSFASLWDSIDDELSKKSFIQEVFADIVIDSPHETGKGGRYSSTPCYIKNWRLNT